MNQSPLLSREGIRATPVATTRRFAGARQVGAAVREYCDLCRAPIAPEEHHDLLDLQKHRIACACEACAQRLASGSDDRFALLAPGDAIAELRDHFVGPTLPKHFFPAAIVRDRTLQQLPPQHVNLEVPV